MRGCGVARGVRKRVCGGALKSWGEWGTGGNCFDGSDGSIFYLGSPISSPSNRLIMTR